MFRPRRSVAAGLIAVITISALVPGLCWAFDTARLEPVWVWLPDQAIARYDPPADQANEQLLPLVSLAPTRAPPSSL